MIRTAAIITIAAFAAGTAIAQVPPSQSFWTSGFNQGISEYSTGTFDQPVDGGIRIACLPDGSATLSTQIKGRGPAAGSRFLLIPATRSGSQSFAFTAGADGTTRIARARSDRQFGRLWAALRGGNNVTVRYGDGSFGVQSLVGSRTTLPERPCAA